MDKQYYSSVCPICGEYHITEHKSTDGIPVKHCDDGANRLQVPCEEHTAPIVKKSLIWGGKNENKE